MHGREVIGALDGGGVFPGPGGVVTWWGKEEASALDSLAWGMEAGTWPFL